MKFYQIMEYDVEESWAISNTIYSSKKDAYRNLIKFKNQEWLNLKENADMFLRKERELYDWTVHFQSNRKFCLKELKLEVN